MPRFYLLVAIGLVLGFLLAIALRWLWRQPWRSATVGRRGLIVIVGAACPVLLLFLVGGLQLLWHERPNQLVTVADLQILEKAEALLKDESSWNRNDDKKCDEDDASRRWSLYCAIEAACRDVVGTCEHTRAASQEVRFAIEEVARGKQFEGRLMGFNNLPETRFEDIKRVLRLARERVRVRLEEGVKPPNNEMQRTSAAPALDAPLIWGWVIWSPQSVRDLESIHAYISDKSARYADLVVGRLVATVERLQAFAESTHRAGAS